MKKVFVLGGTGFLGYHTINALLACGYQVKTMALPPMPKDDLLPPHVECQLGDINTYSDHDILELLKDFDSVIYAAGADERVVPPRPALTFFYKANVLPTQRLARLAAIAGVKKFVIFGSYFAEFAERLPQFELKKYGYTNTRLLQEQVAFAEGEGRMTVTSLRLPYIFGTMPGRMPLWSMFTERVKGQKVCLVPKGGTAMVTVKQVAEAAIGAMERGQHRDTFAISGLNMPFKQFYEMIIEALDQQNQTRIEMVDFHAEPYEAMDRQAHELGVEHGIPIAVSMALQAENLYLDPAATQKILGFSDDDVVEAVRKTLHRCVQAPAK